MDAEYGVWQTRVLDALQSGRTTLDDLRRIVYDHSVDAPYLGGRWLHGHLRTLVQTFPEYGELMSAPVEHMATQSDYGIG